MSEYEGKVSYRLPPDKKPTLTEVLFFEAMGRTMTTEEKARLFKIMNEGKSDAKSGKLTPEEEGEYLTFLSERISVRLSEDYDYGRY